MKVLGNLTSAVLAGFAIIGVIVTIRSLPDIRRYLEMRRM